MVFTIDKSGKKPKLKWDATSYYKKPDYFRSSDYPCHIPRFIPSYEKTCAYSMFHLLGNEYERQWHREHQSWDKQMYPQLERSFFQRRYAPRNYHQRCPRPEPPPRPALFRMRKFANVAARTDHRKPPGGAGCPPGCRCACHRRQPLCGRVCPAHRRPGVAVPPACVCAAARPCGPGPGPEGQGAVMPAAPPCSCPKGPGVPRGQTGPAYCGAVGEAPCGPPGAPRDRGECKIREPVCVPSHAEGPNPAWLPHGEPEQAPPCDPAAGVVCQPPCDPLCRAVCADCGCPKPCQCEPKPRPAPGKCAEAAHAGGPCPSRRGRGLAQAHVCAATCAEPCHGPGARKAADGHAHTLTLPCPCCSVVAEGRRSGAPGGDSAQAVAEDTVADLLLGTGESAAAARGVLDAVLEAVVDK